MTMMALAALDEVVTVARKGPVRPSPSLRFMLAWLYDHRLKGDRSAYDDFWLAVTNDGQKAYSESAANSMRGGYAQTHLNGIARQAGIELTVDMCIELRQMQMTKAERTEYRNSACYRFARRWDRV